ncbi:MAG: aminodeoxychorismate synthase, component I [Chloroflexota bacterium]|nr:aminodeoxychorismate synthase, component I [Chloroflexota bacterium]
MVTEPLIREIPVPPTAAQAFEAFKDRPFCFFLDSGMDSQRLGRFSFLGSDPFLVMKSRGREIDLLLGDRERRISGNPFQVLGKLLDQYRIPSPPAEVPLLGGAVGYLSYDLCHFVERLPGRARDDLLLPESYFGFYDALVAWDHLLGKAYLISTGLPETGPAQRRRAEARLEEMGSRLRATGSVAEASWSPQISPPPELHSNFTHQAYVKAVERAREYISAGDIYQVNLSQRFEAPLSLAPYELYRYLRRINPAPFAAYLGFPEVAVVSSSPERFLRLHGDRVETRPIKGTRPRGSTPEEDRALARELLHSPKDQAEHVMIVDLERNDLGRVCQYGTVRVSELMALESYATVHHLTSTVEGKLRPDRSTMDLLQACFPGGSITGAPKVRSMEIIDELEPTRRSVYTGAIGYLSFNGDLDLNIAIRTILIKEGRAYFQVGGGIVYDSDPEAEYQETLDKARALIQALRETPTPRPLEARPHG